MQFGLVPTVDGRDVLVPFDSLEAMLSLGVKYGVQIRPLGSQQAAEHPMHSHRLSNYRSRGIGGEYMVARLTGLGMQKPNRPATAVEPAKATFQPPKSRPGIVFFAKFVFVALAAFASAYASPQQVEKVMEIVSAQISPAMRISIIKTLPVVAQEIFGDDEKTKAEWYALIGIESRFNPSARSRVGATGLGQVMPGTAKMYAARCGLGGFHPSDLTDVYINARLSACIFKDLLDTKGSVVLALVAYNAGPASHAIRDIQKLKNINQETGSYVSKHALVVERIAIKPEDAETTEESVEE